MSYLEKAITIATHAHVGQFDKGGNPYILHPLRVMMKVDTYDEQIVAVFHDTIEDAPVTAEDLIHEGFSREIVDAVLCLSRNEGESYMDFIRRCKKNELAKKVKIADIEDNLNIARIPVLSDEDIQRVRKYMKAWRELNNNEEK